MISNEQENIMFENWMLSEIRDISDSMYPEISLTTTDGYDTMNIYNDLCSSEFWALANHKDIIRESLRRVLSNG